MSLMEGLGWGGGATRRPAAIEMSEGERRLRSRVAAHRPPQQQRYQQLKPEPDAACLPALGYKCSFDIPLCSSVFCLFFEGLSYDLYHLDKPL